MQPIALYGSEIWGIEYGDIVEKAHLFALKRFLGVDRRTPNELVYGEMGRYNISINANVRCISYWLKLTRMNAERLPYKAYRMLYALDESGKKTWTTIVKDFLFRYGFGFVWINQGVGCINGFLKVFKQRLKDCRLQAWNELGMSTSLIVRDSLCTVLLKHHLNKNPTYC